MLDIKRIRMNTQEVKRGLVKRDPKYAAMIDEVLALDEKRRELSSITDEMKAKQNQVSKQIPEIKKNGGDADAVLEEMRVLSDDIKANDLKISAIEEEQKTLLLDIPNVLGDEIPQGKDDTENLEVKRSGEPRKFEFEIKPHWDLGKDLNMLDPARAGEVTGSRFHFLVGAGARLERAVKNFFLDEHLKSGYTEINPPQLVNRDSMIGTGSLPKFEDDMFHLDDPDYFLIPTAEVPVTNFYKDEILEGALLPIKFAAFSSCFRKEGGSAGRDTRGLIRQHQFQKVELMKFAHPDTSMEELEKLTANAEKLLDDMKIPYRTVLLCSGDVGFSSLKTYDIEVWMPSYDRYVEISSCSNFGDYQARRARIRFKDDIKSKAQHVHTLNGSGLALGRAVAAIMENYQNEDGSITVPEVLVPYMQGQTKIEAN